MIRRPSKKKLKTSKCPTCGGPVTEEFKPFCSKRCAETDLARWLKGGYAIPGAPVSAEVQEDAEPPPSRKPQ